MRRTWAVARHYRTRAVRRYILGNRVARRLSTSSYRSGLVALGERNTYGFPRRWVTVDRTRASDRRIWLDESLKLPFPDESQHVVYAAHVLEHLRDAVIRRALAESFRVLRPGGGIRVEVPDIEVLLTAWRQNDRRVLDHFLRFRQLRLVDGLGVDPCFLEDQLTPLGEIANHLVRNMHMPVYATAADFEAHADRGLDELNEWAQSLKTDAQRETPGHCNIVYYGKIATMLSGAGFTDVRRCRLGSTTIPGLRLSDDGRPTSIAEKRHRQFYSLYAEAIKPLCAPGAP